MHFHVCHCQISNYDILLLALVMRAFLWMLYCVVSRLLLVMHGFRVSGNNVVTLAHSMHYATTLSANLSEITMRR